MHETVGEWDTELRGVCARIAPRFDRPVSSRVMTRLLRQAPQ